MKESYSLDEVKAIIRSANPQAVEDNKKYAEDFLEDWEYDGDKTTIPFPEGILQFVIDGGFPRTMIDNGFADYQKWCELHLKPSPEKDVSTIWQVKNSNGEVITVGNKTDREYTIKRFWLTGLKEIYAVVDKPDNSTTAFNINEIHLKKEFPDGIIQ